MHPRSASFVEFLVQCGALRFGDFTARSGRATPYFVDAGEVKRASQVTRLGEFYAAEIMGLVGHDVDVVFGPAYKGIPLAVTTAMALHRDYGRDVGFCFDRKEAKDHGEGGRLVGHPLSDGDRVVLVEDVTTAGSSIRATLPLLRQTSRVELAGIVVGVDRCERGTREEISALEELQQDLGVPVRALTTIHDVVAHLSDHPVNGRWVIGPAQRERLEAHLREYGARRTAGRA